MPGNNQHSESSAIEQVVGNKQQINTTRVVSLGSVEFVRSLGRKRQEVVNQHPDPVYEQLFART